MLSFFFLVFIQGCIQSETAGGETVGGSQSAGPAESSGAVRPERAKEGGHAQEDDRVLSPLSSETAVSTFCSIFGRFFNPNPGQCGSLPAGLICLFLYFILLQD